MSLLWRTVVRVVLLVLAVLLGFSCLAALYFPTSNLPGHPDARSTRYLGFFTPPTPLGQVLWATQGPVSSLADGGGRYNASAPKNQPLLHEIPRFFQQQLLSGLPYLLSHPSAKGLFRPRYSRFLQTLLDYTAYHSQLRSESSSRTLTWQCGIQEYCGGLGDRIRGVAYALLLAMFSRRRLVVFWQDQPEGKYLLPHMIDWRDKALYNILRQTAKADLSLDPLVFRFNVILDKSGKLRNDVSSEDMQYYQQTIGSNWTHVVISTNLEPSSLLDSKRNGDQDWIRKGLKWCGLSNLQPKDLDDVVGIIFRYLFALKSKVWLEVQSAKEVLGLLPPVPYVALHIRTGFAGMGDLQELVRHPKLEHSVSVWNSSLDCAVQTATSFLGDDSLVFLATDSDLVKDLAWNKYGARVRMLRNPLIHLDKFAKDSMMQLSAREKEGVLVVWVEFLLLAQAEVLVRGESGYSWIAGLISGLHGNRTIDAKQCTAIK